MQKEKKNWLHREDDLEAAIKRSYDEIAQLKKDALLAGDISKTRDKLEHQNKGNM